MMTDLISKYSEQIQDLVMFAKSQNFDCTDGDFDELTRNWIKNRQAFYAEENREEVKRLVKQFI